MEARSVVAEMFIGIPTHFWMLPVAGLVAYFGLKWSARFSSRSTLLQASTYLLLLALAVLPNGFVLLNHAPLPNYAGRFYLDAFYVFSGWALSKVAKLKFS